jgi:DNA helicase-2/ATP-dependent DNA helicase PcrA
MWEQIEGGNLAEFGLKASAENKLKEFVKLIAEVAGHQYTTDAYSFALEVAKQSGYLFELKNDLSTEGRARLENVEELFNSINEFLRDDFAMGETVEAEEEPALATIHSYLANVALITDLEEEDDLPEPKVSLMTVHAAKGLEFRYVYVVGMEENLFPSNLSAGSLRELEEERRLFYVALTRAKSAISLSCAQTRYRWGSVTTNAPSRFLKEIDPQWLNKPLQENGDLTTEIQEFTWRKSALAVPKQQSVRITSPHRPVDPNVVADDPLLFKVGQKVEHEKFGTGSILSLEGKSVAERKAEVNFDQFGTKTLLLKFARMRVISCRHEGSPEN